MKEQTGGCLCGKVRYSVSAQPIRVSFCHCRFCQRVTGGPYAVEPIFDNTDVVVTSGSPKTYDHVSEGSGKTITTHFCGECGSSLFYSFERFPGLIGIQAGTFDDPNWFEYSPDNARHIFLDAARRDTVIPPGLPTYRQHALRPDGEPAQATVYDKPHMMGDE